MRALSECRIPFRSSSGSVLAHVTITPENEAENTLTAPLVELDEAEALKHGETTIQLREVERYEYEVNPVNGTDLRLRCSLSSRRRSLGTTGRYDAGLIDTRSFCGTLLLDLVEGEVNNAKPAVASVLLDVRSLKLEYRTEYRGMLRRLADELAGLVADARSSAKARYRSSFEERKDEGWLQIQLELLRETLESTNFSAALQRILTFPHERLLTASNPVPTDRPIRWTPAAIRQLVTLNPRRAIPPGHPLRMLHGLENTAARIIVPRKSRNLDTLENRFVKFALCEFEAFLTHAQDIFESRAGWGAPAALAHRLAVSIEEWLSHGFFREVGELGIVPLGSPVLQRKAGYREILRWWLRFRTAAELSWDGGEELFHAGQRDMAGLYEYWLFFELLEWFCRRCRQGNRPSAEELVEGLGDTAPNLRLKRGTELGPFLGMFAGPGRRLHSRFSYNRHFDVTTERGEVGSWTRRLHPDYTLTFWPEGWTEEEAERRELLVHVHFDAKYKVHDIEDLFGADDADDADKEVEGNYKRQDLLKMHAYRDAIKRSQGAYVLYPGRNVVANKFKGFFHEILPGLGAFGVAPDENGIAQGLESLEDFLGEVLTHLSNRTTAQERVSFHLSEAYSLHESPVPYATVKLPETDIYGPGYRALPPAEHMVLVAWYQNPSQLAWTNSNGVAIVPLGKGRGAWYVQPAFGQARHLLLHNRTDVSSSGLWRVRSLGYRLMTGPELQNSGYPGLDPGKLHALFEVEPDPQWQEVHWHRKRLIRAIRNSERRAPHKSITNVGRRSTYPRLVSLRDLLNAISPKS